MTRRPTILDVAARAGVSKSTVSLVLQNSGQVKAATRDAVRAAMADIGYVYNRAAAQMRSPSAGLVGLVVNDLRDPFVIEFAAALQMTLATKGYATVIANSDDDADLQAKALEAMIEHGVSALVVSPVPGASNALERIERAGIPTIQVLQKTDASFPLASFDFAAGAAKATRHLMNRGATRIAFVGGFENDPLTQERASAYLAEVERAGVKPVTLHGGSTRTFGMAVVDDLPPDVDGALSFNDQVALGMASGLVRDGVELGRDFRLVGFGDIDDCAQLWPPLSSIACDVAGLARDVADDLTAWLKDGVTPKPTRLAPVDLVARMSSTGRKP